MNVNQLSPGKNECEYALPVHNNTASDVNLETLISQKPDLGLTKLMKPKTMLKSRVTGSWITRASLIEGVFMNGSVDGNGEADASEQETLPFPKILNADTMFKKGCDALKYDDLVVAVDLVSPCTKNQRFHYRFEDT